MEVLLLYELIVLVSFYKVHVHEYYIIFFLAQHPSMNLCIYQPYMYVKGSLFKHPRVASMQVTVSCLNRSLHLTQCYKLTL